MFGLFRKGEANEPETYVAGITATLAKYPENVISAVTGTAGIVLESDFLPSIKQIFDACETRMAPIREVEARRKRVEKQLAERAEWERLRGKT